MWLRWTKRKACQEQQGIRLRYPSGKCNGLLQSGPHRSTVDLLNAVYGSVNDDDWRNIENKDDNNIGDEPGGSGYSSNGSGGSTNGDVSTGDETPILPNVAVLVASVVVILGLVLTSKKKKHRK